MPFIHYLRFLCIFYFQRWRWLIPVLLGGLLGYWACYVIRALNAQPLMGIPSGNALEGFIWAFGKPEIVYFVLTTAFVYLVSDFLPASSFEQSMLIRLGSRRTWWFTRVILVILSTLLYAGLLFGGFFLVVLPQFPLSSEWSPAGLNNFGMGLGYSLKNGSPVQGAVSIAEFLVIGWLAIGLFILVTNLITRRTWIGFLGGALIIILSEMGSIFGGPIGGQGWISYLLIQNHLEYTPLWAPVRVIPVAASWIFWITWIGVCCAAGWISSRHSDFWALEH